MSSFWFRFPALFSITLTLTVLSPFQGHAALPSRPGSPTSTESYRIGSEWGKARVTPEQMQQESWAFRRAALATAQVGGGTGFYLGKFNGFHLIATNYHVCNAGWICLNTTARFPLLKLNLRIEKFFGSWSDVDLAIMSVSVGSEDQERTLSQAAGNFAFSADIYPGQELITIGFGYAGNPGRSLMANQDSDCKVFSGRNEFRKINDPDQVNPGQYSAWSFSNGCDVSHGDSGSAMVDRLTGEVVGIIWTGKIPKSPVVQDSSFLDELLAHPDERVWSELAYAVPAAKIAEKLFEAATDASSSEVRQTLLSVVGRERRE